jgi:drug/metabolite transporter (DMT)-like permease
MTAVLLGLLAALLFGLASYLGPVLSRNHSPSGVLMVGQVAAALAAAALLLVAAPDAVALHTHVLALLAGVANGVALTCMFEAARFLPISTMAPIGATGGAVPVVVALLLGERPDALQLLGIPLAVCGVVLVAMRRAGGAAVAPTALPRKGLVLAAVWALAYGTFLSLFAVASHAGATWAVFDSRIALLVTALVLPLARRRPMGLPRSAIPLAALSGLLILAGVLAYSAALAHGLTSIVSVLATMSPVVTVALAVVLLRERLVRWQRVGLVATVLGVVLLAAG